MQTKSRIDTMIAELNAELAELAEQEDIARQCYCCLFPLINGRRLLCERCADPEGGVARAARMLRGKYSGRPQV